MIISIKRETPAYALLSILISKLHKHSIPTFFSLSLKHHRP